MIRAPWNRRIAAVASLGDENRRKLFDFVASAGCAVSRDDAAGALGLPRSTASFQLDRLVQDGLLAVEFRKLGGRGGPGSGRPAKLYLAAVREVAASVPDRNYDLAAELLVSAIEESTAGGGSAREALLRTAHARGLAAARARVAAAGQAGCPGGSSGSRLCRVPRRGGLPSRGRRRGRPGAAQLSVPQDRRGPYRRGLRHERRLPGRRRGGLRHRPGPGAGPCHRRASRAGRRAAGAVLRPDHALGARPVEAGSAVSVRRGGRRGFGLPLHSGQQHPGDHQHAAHDLDQRERRPQRHGDDRREDHNEVEVVPGGARTGWSSGQGSTAGRRPGTGRPRCRPATRPRPESPEASRSGRGRTAPASRPPSAPARRWPRWRGRPACGR